MSIILELLLMTNEIQGEMPMKDIITTTNALLNLFKTFTNIPTLEIGVEWFIKQNEVTIYAVLKIQNRDETLQL